MPVAHDVPMTFWAQVAVEEQGFQPGEHCVLLGGGHVTIVGTDPELGRLARYSLPRVGETADSDRDWRGEAGGTLCPDGLLVFLPAVTVSAWPAQGEVGKAMRLLQERRAAAVRTLLREEGAGNGMSGAPGDQE